VDECLNGIHGCIRDVATCVNVLGSYYCICNHGYTGDGKTSCIPEECRRYTKLTDKTRKNTYVTKNKKCDNHLGPGWFRFHGDAGTKMPTVCQPMSRCETYGTECRRYTKLTDKTRKTTYVTKNKKCDHHLGPGWFRFQGDAGTKMPTKCQPMSRCDAYKTGWLRGTHPSVAEGAVNKTVCFRYRSCCKYSVIIRVRNCGSYYVYHLINTPEYVDECQNGIHECIKDVATCVNQLGSYYCICNHGYTGDGKTNCIPEGDAGTKMPTKCQPLLRCDAYKTGWLRGTHPSVAEGAVNRTVCFRHHSCCTYSVIIRVRNCGSYYVYHLINTPSCTLRYCGTGNAGTKMPTKCLSMSRCGTYGTGWLRGTHPSVAEG
ncbi:hypothetical protein pdam_00016403, partial [Pocillopora damicornis]